MSITATHTALAVNAHNSIQFTRQAFQPEIEKQGTKTCKKQYAE